MQPSFIINQQEQHTLESAQAQIIGTMVLLSII